MARRWPRRSRRMRRFSETLLIMLTSVGHLGEVRNMEGAAVDASLVKPVRQWQLLNAISTSWSKQAGRGRAGARPRLERPSAAMMFEGSGIRVLLVEDNVVNQKVAARMLERLGLRRGCGCGRAGSSRDVPDGVV